MKNRFIHLGSVFFIVLALFLFGCAEEEDAAGEGIEVEIPLEIQGLISENCAGCHTTALEDHYAEPENQCASCHIPPDPLPIGHPVASSAEGCTFCHADVTPENTHIWLGDDSGEDQLAFRNDVSIATCNACHNNATINTGMGFPNLSTDDAILATVANGTFRSSIQPGESMAKYLTDSERTTITQWVDEL